VHLLFDKYGIDPELYPNILISLTEAVNNAIQHGNQNDVSKVVSVSCDKVQTVLYCEISDEGPGFDPNALPDPTAPENLEKPGGRGVFLMRQLSDRVFYKNNGSTVTLEFNL
jgi:serine/threonine-protein kinase RsbW